MTDTEQILIEMSAGFGKLHERLNQMIGETASRQISCSNRFSAIERDMGIRTAVNGEKDKAKVRKVDFQSFLVRSALASIILGIGVILWKIFLGHIDLIVK
jgi:hypothetical protein